jgi:para-aminobenzoate synthetase
LKTLLIDNYDSFTYNLFQLLAEANGEEPLVVRNDEASWAELSTLGFDNVVISPGPDGPTAPATFGVCAEAIRVPRVPLLGVCLGHQGLAPSTAPRSCRPGAVHGRLSAVLHDDSPLFAGSARVPGRPLPLALRRAAAARGLRGDRLDKRRSADGGRTPPAPLWGVQFHPESVCTEHGRHLLGQLSRSERGVRSG